MELLKTKCSKAQYTEIRQAIESYINSQINSESEHLKSVLIQEIEENLSHVADLSSFKVENLHISRHLPSILKDGTVKLNGIYVI